MSVTLRNTIKCKSLNMTCSPDPFCAIVFLKGGLLYTILRKCHIELHFSSLSVFEKHECLNMTAFILRTVNQNSYCAIPL